MDLSQTRKIVSHRAPPVLVLAVGGLDPGAGAGLGRDLLTAQALGAAVRLCGTAFTEQSAERVVSVEPRAAGALEVAVRHALRPPRPAAVKIGMVTGPDQAAAVLRALAVEGFTGPVVVDPVLRASSGGALWAGPADGLLPLLRRATLATPNAPEAEALTGRGIETVPDAERAAADLRAAGVAAVLLKGGHLPGTTGKEVTDILATAADTRRFSRAYIPGRSPRGTGCALATALAVELGGGATLADAVQRATDWLAARIAAAADVAGEQQLG